MRNSVLSIKQISNKKEKILTIIMRAGGPSSEANIKSLKIIRRTDRVSTDKIEKIEISIPIDYELIKRNPNSKKNITLQSGDEIVFAKTNETVKVFGAVQLNSEIPYQNGKRLRYYVSAVGGYSDLANKKKAYVVYANGIAKSVKNYGLFRVYPKIQLGSEIIIPKQPIDKKEKISAIEIASIAGVVGSLTGMTVAIINLLTK